MAASAAAGELRIRRLSLEPSDPLPGQTVAARVEVEGVSRHELALDYQWSINGVPQNTVGPKFHVRGVERDHRISVSVTAHHGERRSVSAEESVQVGNSPPVLHSLLFEPMRELSATQDIRAIPNASDADGDSLEFEYRWRVNGDSLDSPGEILPASALSRGDQVQVTVRASDGTTWSNEIRSKEIPVVNAPPKIASNPGAFDDQGRFIYSLEVDDPDGDRQFAYRLLEGPDGMVMDVTDGTLRWSPTEAQAGKHPVRVEVRDTHGGIATQSFAVELGFEDAAETVPAAAEEPY